MGNLGKIGVVGDTALDTMANREINLTITNPYANSEPMKTWVQHPKKRKKPTNFTPPKKKRKRK